jgi:hypothetical protein
LEKLLLFFVVALIGIALRFFILGKFEWEQLLIASGFLAGALLIWGIQFWQAWRDARYEGAEDEDVWHMHMAERFWNGKKRLFKGAKQMGEFWRFFPLPWQRIANSIFVRSKSVVFKFVFYICGWNFGTNYRAAGKVVSCE